MLRESDVVALVTGLSRRRLRQWVEAGWVMPAQSERGPAFSDIDVARVRLILHVKRLPIGTPFGRRIGTPYPACRAAMRAAIS